MDKLEPKIGVIIPNYNYGRYIDRAIESVYSQNYNQDLIYISVCDDCSTDDSLNILNKYVNNPRFTLTVNTENKKQPYTMNKAIEAIWDKVDIFAILDADDIMLPNKTTMLTNAIISGGGFVGASYGDYIHTYDNGRPDVVEFKEPFSRDRLKEECIVHSNAFISKYAYEKVMKEDGYLYDESLHPIQDYDMWLRIARHFMIIHVPVVLSKVLVHKDNSTNTVGQQRLSEQHRKLWNKLIASQ